jgi:hypothetical protein
MVDDECGSGMCFMDEGVGYCSRPCGDGCGDAFHCRAGLCARGPLEGIGGGCVLNDDCADGLCAARGDERFCTAFCASPDECPGGFACEDVGAGVICVPELALIGQTCAVNAECTTGLCVLNSPQGDVCTRLCGSEVPCSPGFECTRIGGGVNICLPSAVETPGGGGGGCSVGTRDAGSSIPALLLLFGLIVGVRRLRSH